MVQAFCGKCDLNLAEVEGVQARFLICPRCGSTVVLRPDVPSQPSIPIVVQWSSSGRSDSRVLPPVRREDANRGLLPAPVPFDGDSFPGAAELGGPSRRQRQKIAIFAFCLAGILLLVASLTAFAVSIATKSGNTPVRTAIAPSASSPVSPRQQNTDSTDASPSRDSSRLVDRHAGSLAGVMRPPHPPDQPEKAGERAVAGSPSVGTEVGSPFPLAAGDLGHYANTPKLEIRAKKEDSALADRVSKLAADIKQGHWTTRLVAMAALAQLGAKGKGASRELCESLLDRREEVSRRAFETLDAVNPGLLDVIHPLLSSDNYAIRIAALQKLKAMDEDGRPAVQLLLFFKAVVLHGHQRGFSPPVYDSNPHAALVVDTLATVAPNDPAWTGELDMWLSDTNPSVREIAAKLTLATKKAKPPDEQRLRNH
jgi:hypothetical protein